MKYTVNHGVVRKIKNSIINTALSLVLLTSGLSGSLPFLLSGKAFAATQDVCPSGCTYSTIQAAIDGANSGDTITVAAGTYAGNNINANKSVAIVGASGAVVQVPDINGTDGFDVNANDVTISGLTITGPADGTSYLSYAWGGTVTRGIAVHNGVTGFDIHDNTIKGLRNDVLIDGRNNGSLTNNVIDNSKSGVSVQYTDAGTGNTEGYSVTMTGNHDSTYGNEWGVNMHLNGHYDGSTYYNNSQKIATDTPAAVQTALKNNSAANGGWTIQDQGYTNHNRTAVSVSSTGSDANQGSPLGTLATLQAGVDASVSGGTVNLASDMTVPSQVNVNNSVTFDGHSHTVSVSGTGYRFLVTAAGTTFKDMDVTKTDKAGIQNIIGIQASDVTVDNVDFTGQFVLGDGDISRALEVSANNFSVKDSSFKNLRQPAYVNSFAGTVTNSYTDGTKGWVLVQDSQVTFTGNTWGTNATDIAIIPQGSGANYYTCAVMAQIKADNHNPSIDNQVLTTPCDTTAPDAPSNLSWKTSTNITVPNNGYTNVYDGTASWQDTTPSDVDHYVYKYWNDITGNPYKVGNEYTVNVSGTSLPGVFNQGEGVHHFCVEAVDAAGNTSACTEFTITYDHTAPTVTVTPAAGSLLHGTVTFNITVADDNVKPTDTVWVYLYNNAPPQKSKGASVVLTNGHGTFTVNTALLSDGLSTLDVQRLADSAGNYSGTTDNYFHNYTIDNTRPGITFTNPSDFNNASYNQLFTTGPNLAIKATDTNGIANTVLHVYNSDNSPALFCNVSNSDTTSCDTSGLPDGDYYVKAGANDNAGNNQTITKYFTIDSQAPNVHLVSPADGTVTNGASLTQSWGTTSSDVDHYEYESYNDAGLTSLRFSTTYTTTSKTATNVPDATFWWRVRAVDHAGNKSAWTDAWKIVVDNTAPAVPAATLTQNTDNASVANGGTTNSEYFTFHLPAGVDRYQLKYWNDISGSPFNGQANAWNPTDISGYMPTSTTYVDHFTQGEGTHYFAFSACDAAGNCSAYSTPFVVTYDKTAPVVTVDSQTTTDTTPTLTGTVDDSNATVAVTVNGHTYSATVTAHTWSVDVTDSLPVNTYDVAVAATDQTGNIGTDSTTDELTIAAAPASLPPTSGNTVVVNNFSRQLAFTGGANSNGNTNGGNATSGNAGNTSSTNTGVLGTSQGTSSDKTVDVKNASDKNNSKFLGLGWWWLAVVAALAAFWWLLVARRRSEDN